MASYPPPKVSNGIFNENEYKTISCPKSQELNVDSFGEQVITNLKSITSDSFQFDIVDEQVYYDIFQGGSASISSEVMTLNVDATPQSFYYIRNKQYATLGEGNSVILRVPIDFTNAPIGTSANIGLGNGLSDIWFSKYFDGNFYLRQDKGGKFSTHILTITANPSGAEVATVTLNDIPFVVNLVASSTLTFTASQIETGLKFTTPYLVQQLDDTVSFTFRQPIEETGVFSFSSTGTATATFTTSQVGSAVTETLIPSVLWNGDAEFISTFNSNMWHSYQLTVNMLGNIIFEVYDSKTSSYKKLHTIFNEGPLNFSTSKIFLQRNIIQGLGIQAGGYDTFNGSMYITGNQDLTPARYSTTSSKTLTGGVELNILYLNHSLVLNNEPSDRVSKLESLSVSTDGTKAVIIRLYFDPLTVGSNTQLDYVDNNFIDDHSVLYKDINSLTHTSGIQIQSFVLGKVDSRTFSLEDYPIHIHDSVLITAESANSSDVSLSISYSE